MTPTNRNARIAGLLYLLLTLAAPLRLIYIPSALFVRGDATATANNIVANEMLFRLGIVADLFSGTMCIFITLALYRLFRGVDHNLAVLMVILGGVLPAALDFFIVLNDAAALMLARGPKFLAAFDKPQRDALAMLFLRLHDQEVLAAQIFWGIWLFPLAILVYRSRFLPRFLAVWLAINGIAYVVISLTGLLFPHRSAMIANITFPALLGEMAFVLWLLIRGARDRATASPDLPATELNPAGTSRA